MKNIETLYSSTKEDLRKVLFTLVVLLLSFVTVFRNSDALCIAIFVQAASNIDNFWDFLEKKVDEPVKYALFMLIFLSALCAIMAFLNFRAENSLFAISFWGEIIKWGMVLVVSSPIVLLFWDWIINQKKENLIRKGDEEIEF